MQRRRKIKVLTLAIGAALLAATAGFLPVGEPRDGRVRAIMPEVVFVAPNRLLPRDCPAGMTCLPALALYDSAERRIHLRGDWSPGNVDHLGILLHEFVHHLQAVGKLDHPCESEMEIPAYAVQAAFYEAYGRAPEGRVPSPFTRMARYSCAANE